MRLKARRLPNEVEAIFFTGQNSPDVFKWVRSVVENIGDRPEMMFNGQFLKMKKGKEWTILAAKHDWIIYEDEEFMVCPNEAFRRKFEPVINLAPAKDQIKTD